MDLNGWSEEDAYASVKGEYTGMTGKRICVVIIIIGLMIIVTAKNGRKFRLYNEYRYPNEEFYGKDLYSEIVYKCSAYESEIGNELLDRAMKISQYKGVKQQAEKELGDVGALSRYYYYSTEGTTSQDVDLKFITCRINGNKGHVWSVGTVLHYDENGNNSGGGGREMLTLWNIEKNEEGWQVIKVTETP